MAGSVAGLAKTQLDSDRAGVEVRSELKAVWRRLFHCFLLPLKRVLSQLKKNAHGQTTQEWPHSDAPDPLVK